MAERAPETRSEFASEWDECTYVLEHLSYQFWEVEDHDASRQLSLRLEALLETLDSDGSTQRGAEGWALILATRRDFVRALDFKHREVDTIERLLVMEKDTGVVHSRDLVVAVEEYALLAREAKQLEKGKQRLIALLSAEVLAEDDRTLVREVLHSLEEPAR